MIQMRIKTKHLMDIKMITYQMFTLPATFTLVASDTKWDDIVEVMTLVVINPVSC